MERGAGVLLVVAAVALASPAAADQFSGTVSDSTTTDPVAGAEVVVGNDGWPPGSTIYQDLSDGIGDYLVDGLPAATDYTVLVSAKGYASQDQIMQTPPAVIDFDLVSPADGCLVETINQGWRHYQYLGPGCFREDGSVEDGSAFFPGIDATGTDITALLADIGADTAPTVHPPEMWARALTLWEWLQVNAVFNTSDPIWQAASAYMGAEGWPSISRIASTWYTYGIIPWGTCFSRAQIHTTLLYRLGISPSMVAVAETRWKLRYSQHMYTIVWVGNRWVHLDPSFNHHSMPPYESFRSVPHGGNGFTDYRHPYEVKVLPGGSLLGVPEVSDRDTNTQNVYLVVPPDGSGTLAATIDVSGRTAAASVTEAVVNGTTCPVGCGSFATSVDLECGPNTITAEVMVEGTPYSDSVAVTRWCDAIFSDGFESGDVSAWP